ncbi:sel1 repeat family protein [Rhodobacterales bacterium HKCCE2091]|nr:sel1 repeat family protein [Rhodobacterales bacterium HKCCE2091]
MIARTAFALTLLAAPALAQDFDRYGTTNPDELTHQRMVENAENGQTDMMTCASGYLMTKSGDHDAARTIFGACADAGYTRAMTWMSYLEDNGFGGDYNPDASTDWNRQAAEAGDPMGMYNYGLDILRQHGTSAEAAEGREWIDRAAEAGLDRAAMLQGADYDWNAVTPDADNWRYAPAF